MFGRYTVTVRVKDIIRVKLSEVYTTFFSGKWLANIQ